MPSTPTSPITPSRTRKRRSLRLSSIDVTPSPYASGTTNGTTSTFSRRSSHTSQTSYQQHSPITPRPMSSRSSNGQFFHGRKSSRASISSNMSTNTNEANGLGMGSLADELGEVWDADENEEDAVGQGSSFLEGLREGSVEPSHLQSPSGLNDMHDFGFGVGMAVHSPPVPHASRLQTPAPVANQSNRHQRSQSKADSQYDGSDYGPDPSDDDAETLSEIPPSLAKRLREVEKVTRLSTDPLEEDGGVVPRMTRALKDLGPPQSSIENHTTRLITAYTSMATHRTHKTKDLFSQAHSLLYGPFLNLPEEMIDLLLDEVKDLEGTLYPTSSHPNHATQSPLLSLQILATETQSLATHLRTLSDSLQESRIISTAASRRLKSVRDLVEEMRIEEELNDTSIMLIQAGDWDRRCRERQAGKMCGEVLAGFGQTFELARERYIEALEIRHGENVNAVKAVG